MHEITSPHPEEEHRSHRAAWLRAAVLGVNDGIVSTSSLMLGVLAASGSDSKAILTSGIAGLFAGAFSMAVGEYVSVSSQRDSERADIDIEKRSLAKNPDAELAELAAIYVSRGLDAKLAKQVAQQLHDHDAVAAHARDELGIDHEALANPVQAMVASALSFALGALVPIVAAIAAPDEYGAWAIVLASLAGLAVSGGVGAHIGGGRKRIAGMRVFVGGGIAMAITALIGYLIGAAV